MKRSTTISTAALVLAAGLLASGCSSGKDGKAEDKQEDPTAAVLKVARSYQEADNREDWAAACGMSSKRLRGGTVEECTAKHTPPSPTPTDEASSSPSPSFEPPTYADGSTPQPRASRTSSGPERADTGAVSASDVVEVAAVEDHPAGYGVLVTYTYQWPDKDPETTRRALRLVDEGGSWVVDQHEDVQDGDMGHGSPVRAALSGG
ncbi:hypothetical protein [Streptomyces sp. NBC_00078]|uniref:hypothetical protein n=1 Tax=Streptomyces sp. NBC_00078 TaxID=2975643 RepID=UPI0022589AB2|nr:hypothetical protein [Streptomyces sp. NBC_00078]MCX5426081.1 hypothetical protein [Streptomyces sp. NBC_00078]